MVDYNPVDGPRGPNYAAPLIGMQLGESVAGLPDRYYSGKEKQAQIAMREAFPDGIPLDANGQPDVSKIMDIGARSGGAQFVQPLLSMMLYGSAGTNVGKALADLDTSPPPGGAAPAPPPGPAAAAPPPRPAGPPPSPVANDGAPTLRTLGTELAGGKDAMGGISLAARTLRIHPDAPLSPQQVAQATPLLSQSAEKTTEPKGGGPPFAPMVPRNQQSTATDSPPPARPLAGGPPGAPGPQAQTPGGAGGGNGAPAGPGGPAPAPAQPPGAPGPGGPPPMPPGPPQAPPGAPQAVPGSPPPAPPIEPPAPPQRTSHVGTPLEDVVPEGMTPRAYLDDLNRKATRARQIAAELSIKNPKAADAALKQADDYNARFKSAVESISKANELTPEQKNARASNVQSPAALKRQEKIDEALDAGPLEDIKAAQAAGGRNANKRIELLDTVGDALKAGEGKITTGPFAETALKIKQAASSAFGIDIPGQTAAEIATKTGLELAIQTAKQIGTRITQMEIQLALQNNPGVLLGPKGSLFMVDLGKQMARQDIALARLASKVKDPRDWPGMVEEFYEKNPLKSPFTGKPLGKEDAAILTDPKQNPAPTDLAAPSVTPAAPGPKEPIKFTTPEALRDAIKAGTVNAGDPVENSDGVVWKLPQSSIDKFRPRVQQ